MCCTDFTHDDVTFFDTWAGMNERRNAGTLPDVMSFVDDVDGETLHEDAVFAATHGHPALFSYLQ
jgi:hypothetical protein